MKKKPAPGPTSMSLRAAYKQAVFQDKGFVALGVAKQTMMNQRVAVSVAEYPTDKTMRTRLKRAGWRMAVEEQWLPGKARPQAKAKKSAPPKRAAKVKKKKKKK
jgi:hypothetical protein